MTWRCLWESKAGPDPHRCQKQCASCATWEGKSMDFDSYLDEARKTAIYPRDMALEYLALGLVSEAGEVAGKTKKWIRDQTYLPMEEELGDVLWYLAMLADEYGWSLAEIAEKNIEKLRDRAARNVISGSGDHR